MSQYYLGNEHGQLIHDEQFGSHHSDSLPYATSKRRGKKLTADAKLEVEVKRKEGGT
jgi:hypothetical protein